ncbi:MAG: ACT domain-containing protein [Prosthecobacter sp.]|uniref:ACT domain-containing protein n=1 Tax=Prosthecobacter sp. TaxID=1965333 RepID=UPI0025F98121|nr:ACT domain-containing protein [Prosthecobacter sp.]MCF7787495.1 ACT domain-containing protein [Prosthecobacter sp.]
MKQLTVLVPNELGIAARLTTCLAERGINIEKIDIEGVENHGIVVLSVDRYDEALRVLSNEGFSVITQDTLLVRLEDKPGALAAVALRLKDAGLDLRSMHILRRDASSTTASLVCSDNAMAAEVLRDVLVVESRS